MPELFPFEPDWASSVEVEIAYKTETIESRIYREQRIALRTQPRKTVRFDVALMRDDYRRFVQRIAAKQQAEWVIPELTRFVKTSAGAASGAVTLAFMARPAWAAAQSWVVLRAPSGLLLRQIVSVTSTTVTFAVPIPEVMPSGMEVYPGLVGRLSQGIRATTPTNTALKASVELLGDPGSNVYEGPTTAPLTFNGRELWLRKSNWGSVPTLDFEGMLETGDYGRGVLTHFSAVPWNTLKIQREYVLRGQADADDFTAFLHRMKGQQGEFYAPSGSPDFDLSTGALAGSSALVVPGSTVFDLFAADPTYRAVFVRYADGSYQANVVTAITAAGPNTQLAVATPWAQAVTVENTRMVSWLYAMRLSSDNVTIEWLTNRVARAKLTAHTLEDLP